MTDVATAKVSRAIPCFAVCNNRDGSDFYLIIGDSRKELFHASLLASTFYYSHTKLQLAA